jgi:hypothetical protein
MAAETQYTANTGMVTISTANANLDGTGTLGTLLTAGANGTLINDITIKAQVTTTQGMIRLFVYDGTNTRLLEEIPVPAVTKSAQDHSFEITIQCNIRLKAGNLLKVSTEKGEAFNVIANAVDWAYYSTSVRPESTNYTANTGMVQGSTANTNLNGSGTLETVLTAGSSGSGWKGCRIESVNISATVSTGYGMVRLYIFDGTTNYLLTEVEVPAVTKSATVPAFSRTINLNNFQLKAGYILKFSTELGQNFVVIAQGLDWKYPA